jgi:hypothetical protein
MNQTEVKQWMAMRAVPSVTITMPAHRTSPDNKQDPIRLKNLAEEAGRRLLQDFSKREVDDLLKKLAAVVAGVDHERNLDGLAIFVSANVAHAEQLPFELKERVVVADRFYTRDLIFAMNRTPRYYVLALSEQPTRLFEATKDDLVEITAGAFPMTHSGPGGATNLPGGPGVNPSSQEDRFHEQFFRAVDAEFDRVNKQDPLPLAVVGVERHLSFFRQVGGKNDVIAEIRGNVDHLSAHDLGRQVWPEVKQALVDRRAGVFDELGAAIGARRVSSTVGEVWRYAHEGRGALLLVEEGYHPPAKLSEDGMNILISDNPEDLSVMDDATDLIIEEVLTKGGRVVFVPDGSLSEHSRIALILRY